MRVSGPARAMMLCTCTECQKVTGAGHSGVAIFNRADVEISGPLTAFARKADSGATLTRYFCPTCGTPVYAETSRWTGAILLPPGFFGGGGWFAPKQVIFHRSHLEWDVLPDIALFDTYREA